MENQILISQLDSIESELLGKCLNIESKNEYEEFLSHLMLKSEIKSNGTEEESVGDRKNMALIKSFLGLLPKESDYEKLFQQKIPEEFLAFTAICLAECSVDDSMVRELLLGSGSFRSGKASSSAKHYIIKYLGLSGRALFMSILYEALHEHFHFCPPFFVAEAIQELGGRIDKEQEIVDRSITALQSSGKIIIHTDKKFTGYSTCPKCRFFPCKINHYFKGGIQDCKLWNKKDPAELKEISDQRDWGDHLKDNYEFMNIPESSLLEQGIQLFKKKEYEEAMKLLCEVLLLEEEDDFPASWIYLSRCLSACRENELSCITSREASKYKGAISLTHKDALNKLVDLEKEHHAQVTYESSLENEWDYESKAINEKRSSNFTKALDHYIKANINNEGSVAGNWFEMGECHLELKELCLAEVFMRKGAKMARERSLEVKFTATADRVKERVSNQKLNMGLNLQQRIVDRNIKELIYPACSPWAKRATSEFMSVSEFITAAKEKYVQGETESSIDILKAGLGFTKFDSTRGKIMELIDKFEGRK